MRHSRFFQIPSTLSCALPHKKGFGARCIWKRKGVGEKGYMGIPQLFSLSRQQQRECTKRAEKRGISLQRKNTFDSTFFSHCGEIRREKWENSCRELGSKRFLLLQKKKFNVLYSKWLGLGRTDYEKARIFFKKSKDTEWIWGFFEKDTSQISWWQLGAPVHRCSTMCLMYVSQIQQPLYMIYTVLSSKRELEI